VKIESFEDVTRIAADILAPPERISVSEAAEKYRYINNAGAYIGKWMNNKVPEMVEIMDTLTSRKFKSVILVAPAQSGKALDVETPMATPDGWTSMGKIQAGDYVFDENGKPVRVVTTSDVFYEHDCFAVMFSDGSEIVADANHRWTVSDEIDYKNKRHVTLTTREISSTYKHRNRNRYAIPVTKPLDTPEAELPIDPYTLGVWLGDGNTMSAQFTQHEKDAPEVIKMIKKAGHRVVERSNRNGTLCLQIDPCGIGHGVCRRGHIIADVGVYVGTRKGEPYEYCAECARQTSKKHQYGYVMDPITNPTFYARLSKEGLIGSKHIPASYLRASVSQRMELLRGLMDTDGSAFVCGRCEISSSYPKLASGIIELIRTLGFKPCLKKYQPKNGKEATKISFTAYSEWPVFHMERKRARMKSINDGRPSETLRRRIVDVKAVESRPVKCIAVDSPTHLFLAGDAMIPTHNTEAILNWLLYSVVCDPMDMILFQTSMTMARDFSKRRVDRMHRHSPSVGKRLMLKRGADNTLDKHYSSGMIFTISYPSVNEVAGRPIGRVAITDYDRINDNIGGEGNLFDLAAKRTTTYGSSAMTFAESSPSKPVNDEPWEPKTPHEAPPSPGILALYNRGDRRRWFWKCPHCGEWFESSFSLLQFSMEGDPTTIGESAVMACPSCGSMIPPEMKTELRRNGRWVADGQKIVNDQVVGETINTDTASFWLKGTSVAFASWSTIVSNYIKAYREWQQTGSEESLKTTTNVDQGEAYFNKSRGAIASSDDYKQRATHDFDEPTVPESARLLIATVDVQKNRFEVQIHAASPPHEFGMPYSITVIDRFAIVKSKRKDEDGEHLWVKPASQSEDWDLLIEQVMDKTYPIEGTDWRMKIRLTLCDSGGAGTTQGSLSGVTAQIYLFYSRLRKVNIHSGFMPVKGRTNAGAPMTEITHPDASLKGKTAIARGDIPVMLINSNKVKDAIFGLLNNQESVMFSSHLDDNFYKELVAETRNERGEWKNEKKQRNEAFDLLAYCWAACWHLRIDRLDWNAVPWLCEHDKNIMVVRKKSEPMRQPEITISDLGAMLG